MIFALLLSLVAPVPSSRLPPISGRESQVRVDPSPARGAGGGGRGARRSAPGRRPRAWSGSRSTRPSTGGRPSRRPRCSCGTRPRPSTSASGLARRRERCAPAWPTATASTPRTRSRSSSTPSTTGGRPRSSRSTRSASRPTARSWRGRVRRASGFSGLSTGREVPDLSPDFVFDSKGRLTPEGYEVEVRIPFKSLRYQAADQQDWGLSVIRRVQSSGHEDTWAPARRQGTSFLAQAGTLDRHLRPAARTRSSTSIPW